MLTSIAFRNFRNLADARWAPGAGAHLLVGPNGAGKTSLLEAIYLLATTRSFRTPRLEECRRLDAGEFTVVGRVENDARFDLEVGWEHGGRRLRLNGKPVSGARCLEVLPVICWSAADLKVIEGGPRDRRRFLDQGVVGRQPAAVQVLSRYRRSLEQKRQLLRQRTSGLDAWNEVLAVAAADLIKRRAAFVASLATCLESIIDGSELDLPHLRLSYRPSPTISEITPQSLLEAFAATAPREVEEGRVLAGPHRDELAIAFGGVDISKIASAGEKKIVGMLLCAARGRVLQEVGREPIVLLDDVDAELDTGRLRAAWRLFDSAPQIVATSCHDSVRTSLGEARVWRLESGSVDAS